MAKKAKSKSSDWTTKTLKVCVFAPVSGLLNGQHAAPGVVKFTKFDSGNKIKLKVRGKCFRPQRIQRFWNAVVFTKVSASQNTTRYICQSIPNHRDILVDGLTMKITKDSENGVDFEEFHVRIDYDPTGGWGGNDL